MIAFAAKAGSTASDGDSKNSPFATALVDHLTQPGLDLRKAFGFVRDDVLKATGNAQEPFVYGSLGGNDVALVPAAPASTAVGPADQDATMQRNYEFALQVSSKPVWDAFIEKYPTGFFTALAKAHRDKLAAEAARVEATNKAKAAQEEQTRLAIEGARAAEQAKAAEQARATEKARVAAELAKRAEEAKVGEAERVKAAAIAKAAEEAKVAEAERLKAAVQAAKSAEDAKAAADQKASTDKVAALTPPADKSDQAATVDIPRSLQAELRRVGCNTGSVDGNWNAMAQKSLDLFNKHAGMKLDVKVASVDALDAVKSKTASICPLICDHGYKADGERCVKISCGAGLFLNDDNECEKKRDRERPSAKREEPRATPNRSERAKTDSQPANPQASGQIVCGQGGCRPVAKGCKLVRKEYAGGATVNNFEVCN
jgi:hypothetical protein